VGTTPNVGIAFGAAGQDSVANAIGQLASSLRQLREEQQQTRESSLTLGKLFEGFLGYEIINRVREFGKEAFESSVQIGKLSQQTGVSARTLSIMSAAAAKVNVDQQQLGKSIVFLESSIAKLNQGNTQAAKSFGLIGLSAKDFVGLNTDQKVLLVTDAIGRMANGDTKAAAAKALLSKTGAQLIPVLNLLAKDGFAKVAEEAEKMGLVINQDTADSALGAAIALKGLSESVKGVATQFEGGLTPALADSAELLVKHIGGDGAKAFATLGQYAGNVLKFMTEGFINTAGVAKSTFLTLGDVAVGVFRTLIDEGVGVFKAFGEAAHGDFSKAANDIKVTATSIVGVWKDAGHEIADTWKDTYRKVAETDKEFWDPALAAQRQKARLANFHPDGSDANTPIQPVDDKLARARLALLKSEAADELNIWKALRAAEDSADKDAYDRGVIGIDEYFARRRASIEAAAAREIAVLEAEYKQVAKAPASNEVQRIQKQQELEAIQAKIAGLEVQASTQQIDLDRQEYTQKIALAKELQGYEEQLLTAQGKTFAATIVKINQEAEAIRQGLQKAGLTPEAIQQILGQLQQAKTLAAQFEEERRQASLVQGNAGLAVGQLDLDVQSGAVLEVNRQRELSAIYAQEVPQLQQIAAAMLAIAQASGDPEKVLQAQQFAQQVQQIANQADYARQQWVSFENTIVNGVQGDLQTFFSSTIDNAKSVGDAFEKLGLSIGKTFQKAIGDYVSKQATQKLTSLLHLDSTAGGTKAAGSFSQSSTQMIAAGSAISQSAAALAVAASDLMSAAQELAGATGADSTGGIDSDPGAGLGLPLGGSSFLGLGTSLFSSFSSSGVGGVSTADAGGVGQGAIDLPSPPVGAAGGGAVRGPGTSTSDSIPAMLSDGEYVTRASAVKKYGVGLFHSLNAMRFAEGGLALKAFSPLRLAWGGPAISTAVAQLSHGEPAARAAGAQGFAPAAPPLQLTVHPDALHMTLSDWLQGEVARQWSRR